MTLHRRAFLQVLTAGLAALGWVRPAKAEPVWVSAEAYAKNHSLCRLFDGYPHESGRFIRSAFQPLPAKRQIVIQFPGQKVPTAFTLVHELRVNGAVKEHSYVYESGPKWWTRG